MSITPFDSAFDFNTISNEIRSQFPIFDNDINHKPLIYLDSGATCQKPQQVIDSINNFYSKSYSSNHSVHFLANECSLMVENTRHIVAQFINAKDSEIVLTSGATDSLNLIANSLLFGYLEQSGLRLTQNSTILISIAEHHSNLLPWQRLARIIGCNIVYFGLNDDGSINMQELENQLTKVNQTTTNLICVNHISNVFGLINDIGAISQLAKNYGALTIVDGTQAVAHIKVDVEVLDCDFYCFSGHKIYGPTGVGVLFGKKALMEQLSNNKVGGEMVQEVSTNGNYYKQSPWRLEAGTANFAGIVGLGSSLEWFETNRSKIEIIESFLTQYLSNKLKSIDNLTIYGDYDDLKNKISLFSCNIKGINGLDLATELDLSGIAIRSGQHCTGLLHQHLDISSSWRVSLACYNNINDIDCLIQKLSKFTK